MTSKKTKRKVKKAAEKNKGEQLDLIDVYPKNMKTIIAAAKKYKRLQADRLAALELEVEQKQKVLDLIHGAKFQTLDDGKIKFEYQGITITVTPRDELISIKEKTKDMEVD